MVVSPLSTLNARKRLSAKQRIIRLLYNVKAASMQRKAPKSEKCCFHPNFISAGKLYTGTVAEEYDPNIPAIVVNTSGTSGESVKGAMHSNKSYNVFVNQISILFTQVKREDTNYGYIPFFSMYGSSTGLHASMVKGAVLNLIPSFKGKSSILQLLNQKSNIMIGVPTMYETMVEICKTKKSICRLQSCLSLAATICCQKNLRLKTKLLQL